MQVVYWVLIALAAASLVLGLVLGNLGLGGIGAVVFALSASAVDPKGRGLARYWRK